MFDSVVFSDGGCIGNPGPGGWAAILLTAGIFEEFGGADPSTTNNRMEMTGAIEGLERTAPGTRVRVVTDSRYLVDGATKWIRGWKAKGWVKADGEPVLNRDLWERLAALGASRKVSWEHVRGHRGHPENERCDEIANGFARGKPPELKKGDGSWIVREKPAPNPAAKQAAKAKPAKKKVEVDGPEGRYDAPIYLSEVDGDVREHATWGQCEARIKGVKGGRCRKVSSRREHIEALAVWGEDK